MHVTLIASRIALGYAYPIRAHPCRVALSVHHNANTAVVDGWQERGYLVQRTLLLKLRDHALMQITRVLAHAEYCVNDLLRARESGGRV